MTENFRKKNFETTPENRFTKKTFSDSIVTPAIEKTRENDFWAIDKPTRKKSDISAFSTDTSNGIQDTFEDSDGLSYKPKRKERIDRSQKPYESTDFAELVESDYDIDKNSPFSDFPLTGKLGIRTEAYGETKNHSGINRKMPEGTYIKLPMAVKYKNSGYDYEHGNWIELEDKKGNTLSYRNLMDFGDFSPGTVIPGNTLIARSGKSGKDETLREEYYSPEGRNITESYWRDNKEVSAKESDIIKTIFENRGTFDGILLAANKSKVANAGEDSDDERTIADRVKEFTNSMYSTDWMGLPVVKPFNLARADTISKEMNARYNYYKNSEKTDVTGYILGQSYEDEQGNTVSDYEFGLSTIKSTGCGTVAIHNALVAVNDAQSFKDVIYECESISTLGSLFGCNPYMLGKVFNEFGHDYNSTADVNDVDEIISSGNVFVISFWNSKGLLKRIGVDKDGSAGMHIVAFKKNDDNTYTAWNIYNNQSREYHYSNFESLKRDTYEYDENFVTLYSVKG